jgi:hypothetical protein
MEKSLRVFSIRNSLHSFSHTFSMVLSDTGLVRKLRFWIMTLRNQARTKTGKLFRSSRPVG